MRTARLGYSVYNGYVEGQNGAIKYRWAENHMISCPQLAADLVSRKVDLFTTIGSPPSGLAAKGATQKFSIVFAQYGVHIALVIGVLLLALTSARAAAPGPINMRIELYGFAGFHVATNLTTEDESANRYVITTDVESRGIASLLADVKTHSQVHGRLSGDLAYPDAYIGEFHRNGADSYNRVDYAPNGAISGGATPPIVAPIPVSAELTRGTIDQLSAFFRIERQLTHRGSCALDIAVFDGRRRYDLHFSDGPPQILAATGLSNFAGPTQVCLMRREAIAGFSDLGGRGEGVYEGTLWYARLVPGDLVVPVQMEFLTEFGAILGHLAVLHGRGIDLRFGE
jgi:hypothetical protein